jgi:hypothetical protein
MGRSAGISWRIRASALATLLPFRALTACGSRDQAMADKLAAAQAAADRAVAAQHAAEQAAAAAAAARPAPAAEPTVMSDLPDSDSDGSDDNGSDGADDELSLGGSPQTVAPDGTVIPSQGA